MTSSATLRRAATTLAVLVLGLVQALLGLASTFDIDWDLPSTTAGLGTPTALTVGFDNITLDASKFIGTSLSGATRGVRASQQMLRSCS